jgi:hypothetical protein
MGPLTLGARRIAEGGATPLHPAGKPAAFLFRVVGRLRWHADRGAPEGLVGEASNVRNIRASRSGAWPLTVKRCHGHSAPSEKAPDSWRTIRRHSIF